MGNISANKNVNPLSLASTLNEKSAELLNESKRYAKELSMKIDKTEDLLVLAKERKLNENLQSLDQSLQMIDSFKKFNIDEVNFSSLGTKKPLKSNIDIKIEDEVCNLIVELDLDLLVEYPPSDLKILIEQCHSTNEDIIALLVQNTLNSSPESKLKTLPKRLEVVISQFLKLIVSSETSLPLKIGDSLDSHQLQESFAQLLCDIFNVYFIDSRKVEKFYEGAIEHTLHNLDFTKIVESDKLNGKHFSKRFIPVLLFTYFQDEQCYDYAVGRLARGVFDSKNERVY
jgi:hypothetical protein